MNSKNVSEWARTMANANEIQWREILYVSCNIYLQRIFVVDKKLASNQSQKRTATPQEHSITTLALAKVALKSGWRQWQVKNSNLYGVYIFVRCGCMCVHFLTNEPRICQRPDIETISHIHIRILLALQETINKWRSSVTTLAKHTQRRSYEATKHIHMQITVPTPPNVAWVVLSVCVNYSFAICSIVS